MKLNGAEFYSKEPMEGMIIDLVRDNAKRGEFAISGDFSREEAMKLAVSLNSKVRKCLKFGR